MILASLVNLILRRLLRSNVLVLLNSHLSVVLFDHLIVLVDYVLLVGCPAHPALRPFGITLDILL